MWQKSYDGFTRKLVLIIKNTCIIQVTRIKDSPNKNIPSLITVHASIDINNLDAEGLWEIIIKYFKNMFFEEGLFLKREQLEKEMKNWKIESIFRIHKTDEL